MQTARVEVLSPAEVERIHAASMEIRDDDLRYNQPLDFIQDGL